jgi:hypothetical protein
MKAFFLYTHERLDRDIRMHRVFVSFCDMKEASHWLERLVFCVTESRRPPVVENPMRLRVKTPIKAHWLLIRQSCYRPPAIVRTLLR